MGYDFKLAYCLRPEHVRVENEEIWREINHHLQTKANSIEKLIQQLSERRFGRNVIVGDCFCGGGSIPFEAARIGCDTFGSDLNPVAGLLTWASLHLCGASPEKLNEVNTFMSKVYEDVNQQIQDLGIETNDAGHRAFAYLYCNEAKCPECGKIVPLLPSRIIGKGTRTIVDLIEEGNGYSFKVTSGVEAKKMKEYESGTIGSSGLLCPHCGKSTPVSVLRHDGIEKNGNTVYGLRKWDINEFEAQQEDVFHERLYAIKYERPDGSRYYCAPSKRDLSNEKKVQNIVEKSFADWQLQEIIPTMAIESGYNTDQIIRERGWGYWHQLFNPRQSLIMVLLQKSSLRLASTNEEIAAALLGLNRCLDFDSKLSRWVNSADTEHGKQTFYNQALNTLFNYSCRSFYDLKGIFSCDVNPCNIQNLSRSHVLLSDARNVDYSCDFWITDPPYADAVNYHELSEFFLAWDKPLLRKAFPGWYADSKRVLAVRGDEHFSQTMIEIYSNLTCHMSDDGMQVVMFTHSNPAVWAQLALIMWKSGLTVTAAWNIATETDASGLKDGNYVKGTVLLVLRKQLGEEEAFLDELFAEVKSEVKNQIESMQDLDDREDPNFSDPDYVLAAYAASLKVLTGYKSIVEIDLDYELDLAIHDPSKSEVVKLIERAKKIAYDFIIPLDFDHFLWRDLSAAERFYVKGLEAEKHGNYQVSTYQEYARGFGLTSYSQLMASERANTARLKVPQEFGMRTVGDVPGFEQSILRLVLASIHVAIKEDENPEKGFWHIKNNLADYWGRRDMLRQLFSFLKDTEDIDTMPHWHEAAIMASHIYTMIDNDHI